MVADHGQQSFDSFGFKHIPNEEVYNALISMNTTKATGGDNIPAKAIKLVAGQIAPSIGCLFNESFNLGTFPSSWKIARVSPLFKGGDPTDRDNQRPISVLPCLSNVLERFADSQLKEYAENNNLISDNQFAYRRFSSCNIALIRLVDDWKWAIDNKKVTIACFLDLRKAFDIINHEILLLKLKNAGIIGTPLVCFTSYLNGRKQYVCCNGYSSDVMNVEYGVPQGSVLGPTAFCRMLNILMVCCSQTIQKSIHRIAILIMWLRISTVI